MHPKAAMETADEEQRSSGDIQANGVSEVQAGLHWACQEAQRHRCTSKFQAQHATQVCLHVQRPRAAVAAADDQQDGSGHIQANEVAEVQAAVDLVQRQMRVYDGSFLQFRCDEKGFLSICAFGLPGKTHEDSPARAIQACCAVLCCAMCCAVLFPAVCCGVSCHAVCFPALCLSVA